MKLKSYFAPSVEAAMDQARRELGEDALLVSSRPTTPVTRLLGAYEVVFGTTGSPAITTPAAASVRPAQSETRMAQDVADIRREIGRLSHSLRTGRVAPSGESEIYTELLANEFDAGIAQQIADGTRPEELFETDATLGRPGTNRAVVALVGPPGVGKTTTLVKLALQYGLAMRRPSQILTTDVYRIAAADQLRSLAGILGIGFDVLETPLALAQSLEEHRSKDLVFIDTPGLARCEMEDGADLACLLASHPEIDTHLVLSASGKSSDLAAAVERYDIFQPRKLLFTRMDETERFGALVNRAAQSGLPVSFLTMGQRIPDDLEPATPARIAELALGRDLWTRLYAPPRALGATA